MDHPDQVADYVARTVLGEANTPQSLAAGAWSTAYALTVAGRAMVLRVSRYGADFAKDEAVSAAVRGILPVPAVTARGETAGWAYAVSERLTGTPLDDLDASALAAVLPDLFDVMDVIRRIEAAAAATASGIRPGRPRSAPGRNTCSRSSTRRREYRAGGPPWPRPTSVWSRSTGAWPRCAGSRRTCRTSAA